MSGFGTLPPELDPMDSPTDDPLADPPSARHMPIYPPKKACSGPFATAHPTDPFVVQTHTHTVFGCHDLLVFITPTSVIILVNIIK